MNKSAYAVAFLLALGSNVSLAADVLGESDPTCPACSEATQTVCLNLKCDYEFRSEHGSKHCVAIAKFDKAVTEDGGEVSDFAGSGVDMEVSCEGLPTWSTPARRETSLIGTRIQGQQGPDPAILLPRGVLHSNSQGHGAGHYSRSVLELQTDEGFKRARGTCFIWSGNP